MDFIIDTTGRTKMPFGGLFVERPDNFSGPLDLKS